MIMFFVTVVILIADIIISGGINIRKAKKQFIAKEKYIYVSKVTDTVAKNKPLVKKTCKQYKISKYEDIIMAMIQQESSGLGIDIMQSSESNYGKHNPVISVEESVDAGVHYFSECLKSAKCKSPYNIKKLSLALQGYNYGRGFIKWTNDNYGGYSEKSALIFSEKMKTEGHTNVYGDPKYVKHILRYYKKKRVKNT